MATFVREIGLSPIIVKELAHRGIQTVQYLVKVLNEEPDAFSRLRDLIGLADLQAALVLEKLVDEGELGSGTLQTIPDSLRSSHNSHFGPHASQKAKKIAALRRKLTPIQNRISGKNRRDNCPLEENEYRALRLEEGKIVRQLTNLGAWD